jgi:hypothetical protein
MQFLDTFLNIAIAAVLAEITLDIFWPDDNMPPPKQKPPAQIIDELRRKRFRERATLQFFSAAQTTRELRGFANLLISPGCEKTHPLPF